MQVQRAIDTVESSDIVIVPSVLLRGGGGWQKGRYPRIVEWLQRMHARGRGLVLGVFRASSLLAETGLYDGKDATVHFGYVREIHRGAPRRWTIHPERVLVISGTREDLVSSGASTTWHGHGGCT